MLTDIHCHILPGIDDGPRTEAESLEMVKQAVADGISTIVTTPHFILGEIEFDLHSIHKRVEDLQRAVDLAGLQCRILPGAENYICPELFDVIKSKNLITLNGTPYVLAEFPTIGVTDHLMEIVREMVLQGYKPIIAHPERNDTLLQKPELVDAILEMGCYFQINGSSITRSGSRSFKFAHELAKKGKCHFIASDGHSATQRLVRLAEPIRLLNGHTRSEVGDNLAQNNRSMVLGNTVERLERIIEKPKGVLGRLREVFSK